MYSDKSAIERAALRGRVQRQSRGAMPRRHPIAANVDRPTYDAFEQQATAHGLTISRYAAELIHNHLREVTGPSTLRQAQGSGQVGGVEDRSSTSSLSDQAA
jgi:hypothetical protein